MRRIVCLFVIVLICLIGMDVVKTVNNNNELYDQLRQKELRDEKNIEQKEKELSDVIDENETKVEEYERYEKWNKEIQNTMQ
jgi:uncharacterized protein YlxW (UPF0749 family)